MGGRVETPVRRVWTVDRHLTVISITSDLRGRAPGLNEKAAAGGHRNGRSEGVKSLGTDDVTLPHRAPSAKIRQQSDVIHTPEREVQHG